MIEIESVTAIVDQYRKFGWELRRILLNETVDGSIRTSIRQKYDACEIKDSAINALWFFRNNRVSETWELRRLEGLPFALVEVINADILDNEREELLRSVEIKIAESMSKSGAENRNGK